MANQGDGKENKFVKLAIAIVVLLVLLAVIMIVVLNRVNIRSAIVNSGGNNSTEEVNPSVSGSPTSSTVTPTVPEVWEEYVAGNYLFLMQKPVTWEEQEREPTDTPETLKFVAADESEFQISYEQSSKSVKTYLQEIDLLRSMAYEGKPSVHVKSSVDINIQKREAVQRVEEILAADMTVSVVYLKTEEYIFVFTVYPTPEGVLENSLAYKDYLSVLGSFAYKPHRVSIRGTVTTGSQIGRNFCSSGYYLELERSLLGSPKQYFYLRRPSVESVPYDASGYLGRLVNIEGIYPPEKNLCKELVCGCEDFILVEEIGLPTLL